MVLGGLQHEVLGVEVDQSVEENARRVGAEQPRFPQVFFRHATNYHSCTYTHTVHYTTT